ncbi:MAG: GAF domain-containing protein [Chloroflexi bacterium]|nr:GAF domain-containing protein [Chloroflexota bacterium]
MVDSPADPAPLALTRMLGRPFGTDEQGRPIDHGSGKLIVGAVEWLKHCVAARAAAEAPPGLPAPELATRVEEAQDRAIERLVVMLNAAIDDPRYWITRDYLLNERNRYSYEFRLFVAEYCRVISGDTAFFQHAGARAIPGAVSLLGRPLGIQRTYAVLPKFTAKFVRTDLRVVHTTPTSAVIRWYGADQTEFVPPPHRDAYVRYACAAYRGGYAAIPTHVFGLPGAAVEELRCQSDGSDYCEWRFDWVNADVAAGKWLLLGGGVATVALLGAVAAGLPGAAVLGFGGALIPVGVAWHVRSTARVGAHRDVLQKQLMEERDLAEEEYDKSEQANANLQMANVELTQRISELTILHEAALTLSTTLEVDAILDQALTAVVRHLGFDRALAMLGDDEQEVLHRCRAVGGTEEMAARLDALELPYSLDVSQLVQAFHAKEPLLFEHVDQDPHEGNRNLARALGASSFIATPLITKGRHVGVLAVDNGLTGRTLDRGSMSLLLTLGRQVAAAIETARLYAEVEAQNRNLEERVAARTAELETTTADLGRELAERRRLRERELEYLAQVNRVVAAAGAVEADAFDPRSLDETAARGDELGQLARTFQRMAGHMIEREYRLKQEVLELRIEIDSARQAKQVAEIVDTEYFRELRAQARDLRRIVTKA